MAKILKIMRRNYVVDVAWKPAKTRSLRAEAISEATDAGVDMIVVREGISPQVGIASTTDGVRSGMVPLAVMAGESLAPDSLVLFSIDDKDYWLVATRGGMIHTDVTGNSEELVDIFRDEMQHHNYSFVAAPPDLELAAPNNLNLDLFVGGHQRKKFAKFEAVGEHARWVRIKIIMLLVVIVGGLLINHKIGQMAAHRKMARLAYLQRLQAEKLATVVIPPIRFVPFRAMKKGCWEVLSHVPQKIHGWEGFGLKCRERTVTVTYRRDTDGLGRVLRQAFPSAKITVKKTGAFVTFPNPAWNPGVVRTILVQNAPRSDHETVDRVDDFFRLRGLIPTWSKTATAFAKSVMTGYVETRFEVQIPVEPGGWVQQIDRIPGTVVRGFDYVNITVKSNKTGQAVQKDGWRILGMTYYLKSFKEGTHVVQGR